MGDRPTSDQVPIVNLSAFTDINRQDPDAQKVTANDLAKKLCQGGYVGITGHGVSSETLKEAFSTARTLFDLPYEDKMKAPHPKTPTPHRGYSGIGQEQGAAKTALETDNDTEKERYLKTKDFKESYEIGSDENTIHGNIWLPDEVFPGFREKTTRFYWELSKTARSIMEALVMSLDLTPTESENVRALYTGHENQLRLLHYPPVSQDLYKDLNVSRLGAHRDFSLFTLLFQDATGGLEFQNPRTGQFVPATPREGVVYMNLGDMAERLSNGLYPSAMHRVVIQSPAEGASSTAARYSLPYFVSPVADATVEPQPSLVAVDGKQKYEPITPREYAQKMFSVLNLHNE